MLNNIVEEPLRDFPGEPISMDCFREEMKRAREDVLELIGRHLTEFGEQFPAETCVEGYYPLTENVEWTTSFWTGQLWLAWEMSGEDKFRQMAEKNVRTFGLRIAGRHDTNTHDLGFLYTLSCVAAWRLTGNRDARGFSLMAAEALLERFHAKAQIIQAWGDLNDPAQAGRMIIDCLMNLPLLYWASEQTGDRASGMRLWRTSGNRRLFWYVKMLRPGTPIIWMLSAGSRAMGILSRVMPMIPAGPAARRGEFMVFCSAISIPATGRWSAWQKNWPTISSTACQRTMSVIGIWR